MQRSEQLDVYLAMFNKLALLKINYLTKIKALNQDTSLSESINAWNQQYRQIITVQNGSNDIQVISKQFTQLCELIDSLPVLRPTIQIVNINSQAKQNIQNAEQIEPKAQEGLEALYTMLMQQAQIEDIDVSNIQYQYNTLTQDKANVSSELTKITNDLKNLIASAHENNSNHLTNQLSKLKQESKKLLNTHQYYYHQHTNAAYVLDTADLDKVSKPQELFNKMAKMTYNPAMPVAIQKQLFADSLYTFGNAIIIAKPILIFHKTLQALATGEMPQYVQALAHVLNNKNYDIQQTLTLLPRYVESTRLNSGLKQVLAYLEDDLSITKLEDFVNTVSCIL